MRSPSPVAVALGLALALGAAPAIADDAAGWRIYRDPATDQATAPPPGTLLAAAARSGSRSAPVLQEQLTPDGTAAFVDLRGSFRAAVRAERGADGVRRHCSPAGDPSAATP